MASPYDLTFTQYNLELHTTSKSLLSQFLQIFFSPNSVPNRPLHLIELNEKTAGKMLREMYTQQTIVRWLLLVNIL